MLELSVITAENTIYQDKIEALSAPTVTGEIGILTGHHPLIAKLDVGALRITDLDKTEHNIFVAGGFLEVSNNKITVLADLAENLESIGLDQAIEARKKAQEMLKEAADQVSIEKLQEELRVMAMREKLAQVAQFKKHQG